MTDNKITQLTDEQLAELFIESNEKAVINNNNLVDDIFQEEQIVYETGFLVPDDLTKERIYKGLKNKEILHKTLIDTSLNGNYWNSFTYKLKKIFFNKNKVIIPSQHVTTPDWSYYKMYKNKDTKMRKKYMNDFFTFTELTLRSTKKLKSIFIYEIWLFLLGIAFFTTILLWLQIIQTTAAPSAINTFVNELKSGIFYTNIVGLIVFTVPYILILSMWFMNVNNLHMSKNFHYLTAITTAFAYCIFFVSVLVLSLYHVFDLVFQIGPIS